MDRRLEYALGTGLSLLWALNSQAKELRWTHYGLRPLAMGNAFVAVVDDYNAIFYNPAGLARLGDWEGELINPSVEASKQTLGFIGDLSNVASSSDNTDAMIDLLDAQNGKSQHIGIGWTPHLVFPGIGFGIGLDLDATMVIHRLPSTPVIDIDAGPQVVAPFTLAKNFFEDRLSLGMSLKLVARGGIDQGFGVDSLGALTKKSSNSNTAADNGPQLSDYIQGGFGTGVDVGMLYTPVTTLEPTLGVSIMDVGSTPYKSVGSYSAPSPRLPAVNVGLSLKPMKTERTYLLTTMDMQAINQPVAFSKKLNFGAEFGFLELLKLGAGLHQGYFSTGFTFDVGLLTLRAVTYSEELGDEAGSIEDRRYAVQLKLLI